jgi:ketosteroid isomerase-like protein
MHPHEYLIGEFYAAFANRDAAAMARCYHPDIAFSDPVFPMLRGPEVTAMWAMLTARAGADFDIMLIDAHADSEGGAARWEAHYTFSQTGRRVHNRIDAVFAFRHGKIVRHVDRFSFWRWARQALGPLGLLLGWSLPLKALMRRKARAALAGFMEQRDVPQPSP